MLLSLKRELRIPLADIHTARLEKLQVKGLAMSRLWGTYFPWVIAAGTFAGQGGRTFYCARHQRDTLVLETQSGRYRRYVVEVGAPTQALENINAVWKGAA